MQFSPTRYTSSYLVVKFTWSHNIFLFSLTNISLLQDEKEQLIKTHFWVRQVGYFYRLCIKLYLTLHILSHALSRLIEVIPQDWWNPFMKWNPSEFGGVKEINIPPDMLWVPDIILYNK